MVLISQHLDELFVSQEILLDDVVDLDLNYVQIHLLSQHFFLLDFSDQNVVEDKVLDVLGKEVEVTLVFLDGLGACVQLELFLVRGPGFLLLLLSDVFHVLLFVLQVNLLLCNGILSDKRILVSLCVDVELRELVVQLYRSFL